MQIRFRIQLINFDAELDFYLCRMRIRIRIQVTKIMRTCGSGAESTTMAPAIVFWSSLYQFVQYSRYGWGISKKAEVVLMFSCLGSAQVLIRIQHITQCGSPIGSHINGIHEDPFRLCRHTRDEFFVSFCKLTYFPFYLKFLKQLWNCWRRVLISSFWLQYFNCRPGSGSMRAKTMQIRIRQNLLVLFGVQD